ncbi:MAG: hypothetical protein PVH21_04780 [Myxococcales bacterium]
MHPMTVVISLAIVCMGACRSSRAEERAMETEEIEASAGDEASLVGEGDNEMGGWITPSDEIEAAANPP